MHYSLLFQKSSPTKKPALILPIAGLALLIVVLIGLAFRSSAEKVRLEVDGQVIPAIGPFLIDYPWADTAGIEIRTGNGEGLYAFSSDTGFERLKKGSNSLTGTVPVVFLPEEEAPFSVYSISCVSTEDGKDRRSFFFLRIGDKGFMLPPGR